MGLLGKLFASKTADIKKSAATAEQNLEKRISKDLVEAVISGSLLVSFADGTCDDDEITSLLNLLEAEESFTAWASDVPGLVDRYSKKLRAGYKLGKLSALRELGDLRSSPADAELAFACIETVADNGGISDEERAVLKEIAGALGVAYRG
ncbi:tellurite resistance [Pantoea phage vB_PagM_LIET2]|uniref:Tellurite resistance protein n=1 Tax=Pantoea phage vB_PagM_LIET2 TaxID=2508071 RepID=A0A411AW43_9CAUD|nr:tellurite resistance [Pantoea phage vB_PagM_LIET2]QAX92327.1 tellurite resistance protein [Pantoea phage vB_PagM_LIET2]UJH95974.1 tellurite resistance protein [Pantoea phage Nafs113]